MMKKILFTVLLCVCTVLSLFAGAQGEGGGGGGRAAKSTVIKLASLVPENSPWGAALNKMAANVKIETGGAVDIIIYHNGVAGSEGDVLRKLRLNQIQAAILTSFGLNTITPEILALSCPFLIRNNAELDYVLSKLKPVLEERINQKGFQTIAWSKVGFVNFFSKYPARTPDEMRKTKMGTSDTEMNLINVFKSMGYQLVPEASDHILIDLNTGRVESLYQSPLSAASFQLFTVANNMMDFPIAPFMGGIVMNQTAWRQLPQNQRDIILKHAKVAEKDMDAELASLEKTALDMMKKHGLNVYKLTPAEEEIWIKDTEAAIPRLLGTTFDAGIYHQIVALLKEFRR